MKKRLISIFLIIFAILSTTVNAFAVSYDKSQVTHQVRAYIDENGFLPIPGNHGDKAFDGAFKDGNKLIVFVKQAEYRETYGYIKQLGISYGSGNETTPYGQAYDKNGNPMKISDMSFENQPAYYVFDYGIPSFSFDEMHGCKVRVQLKPKDGGSEREHKPQSCYIWFEK